MKRRVVALLAVATAAIWITAPSASATVTLFTCCAAGDSQIELESDSAGDLIHLRCQGGQAQSDNGGAAKFNVDLMACVDVEGLIVTANAGADNTQLGNITATDFPNLQRVSIDTGTDVDVDTVLGTQLGDEVAANSEDPIDSQGGPDTIRGGGSVFAGPGNDHLVSALGTVDLGPGDDRSNTLLDSESGGPGFDTVALDMSGSVIPDAANARLTFTDTSVNVAASGFGGPPSNDSVGWSGFEKVALSLWDGGTTTIDTTGFSGSADHVGGTGVEIFLGGPGEDLFDGAGNSDVIDGGGGFDYTQGGPGDDQFRLRDGGTDRGSCGEGTDTVVADGADVLTACEFVDAPAPPDTQDPDTTGLKGPKKVKKGKKARFEFGSSEASSTFMCAVDAREFAVCSPPFAVKTKTLKPGGHVFTVFATDAAGNADPSAARTSFKVRKKPAG